ncbi:hypothetical protein [Nodularia sp. UHCC 0506]|uniref:hypothetical protein n=1 Tax=Nodularia sp. UHCC 0506 TaxID=3110243 RepID=UPI002B2203E5|nr:hypothetical protein [Nodularia sp. UHCC 0506]MEA5516214.1 hypothetical protein [Nodularia sp. UHCC 0506]
MIFGFDGNTSGFKYILKRVASNDEVLAGKEISPVLTHKDIRAYARCLLVLLPYLQLQTCLEQEIGCLLAMLSSPGLPHYDRSFLAAKILKLLSKEPMSDEDHSF